jgi:hypothetical protein
LTAVRCSLFSGGMAGKWSAKTWALQVVLAPVAYVGAACAGLYVGAYALWLSLVERGRGDDDERPIDLVTAYCLGCGAGVGRGERCVCMGEAKRRGSKEERVRAAQEVRSGYDGHGGVLLHAVRKVRLGCIECGVGEELPDIEAGVPLPEPRQPAGCKCKRQGLRVALLFEHTHGARGMIRARLP